MVSLTRGFFFNNIIVLTLKRLKKCGFFKILNSFQVTAQSAEYVKYAKIFGDYFWLIFIPTEDLGDPF